MFGNEMVDNEEVMSPNQGLLKETVDSILSELEKNSATSLCKRYESLGVTQPFFGVLMGVINSMAKQYAKHTPLGIQLWNTNILDAQILAVNVIDPKELTEDEIYTFFDPECSVISLDKFVSKILVKRKDLLKWKKFLFTHENPKIQRLAWGIAVYQVRTRKLKNEEVDNLLEIIEKKLVSSPEILRSEMNHCFATIGINYDEYTDRVIALGEKLQVYKDMKVPKGCTSAYIPEWVKVARKNRANRLK